MSLENLLAIHFIRPAWLLALIPLAILLWLFAKRHQLANTWRDVIDAHLLVHLVGKDDGNLDKKSNKILWLLGSIFLLLTLALAGPAFHKANSPIYELDKLQVILLDASPSTYTEDIKPSRFKRSIVLIKQLLKQHKEGEVMLIAFSGEPYLISPPTTDAKPILNLLKKLDQETLPIQGSRLDLALHYTQKLLLEHRHKKVDILLLTDAHRVDSGSLAIASVLADMGYSLSVLAVAKDKNTPIRNKGGFIKDSAGKVVSSKLNQTLLQKLASNGDGQYQILSNDVLNINNYLTSIQDNNQANKKKKDNKSASRWVDSGIYLALLLVPMVLLLFRRGYLLFLMIGVFGFYPEPGYALEKNTKQVQIPAPAQDERQDIAQSELSYTQTAWKTQDQQAKALYDKDDYNQAAKLFTQPQWRANALYKAGNYQQAQDLFEDLGQDYNQANSLAKLGEYEPAIKKYQQVKKDEVNYRRAQDNLVLVQKILEQKKQQQQQKQKNKDSKENKDSKDNKKNKENKDNKEQKKQDDKQQDKSDKKDSKDKENQKKSKQKQDKDKKAKEDKKQQDKDKDKKSEDKKGKDSQTKKEQEQAKKKAEKKKKARQSQARKQKLEQVFKQIQTNPTDLLKVKFKIERQKRQQNKSDLINNNPSQQVW